MTQRVAVIGECMLELQGQAFGPMTQSYGGDTLNTAVYLRRCGRAGGIEVAYATAVGDDSLSQGLLDRWTQQGLETRLVRRIAGRHPGLYMIQVDERGERSFHYWRDTAAAKAYFEVSQTPLEQFADDYDALYLSGITLAILPPEGRERLLDLMARMRSRATVVFDNNYRPPLWPDRQQARDVFQRAFSLATVALVTADDHQALLGLESPEAALAHAKDLPTPEVVIKRGAAPTLVRSPEHPDRWLTAPTETVARVVDTTAAGDSFAGGYLARRLAGASAVEAATYGNRVAARVIQHHGAVIPAEAMQDLMEGSPIA
ncbi:sugar kinase [Roseateles depolymerans]|uniref:2-dehydro-3-deoxygluconokinase n=1 Tax=Roseateles depolymerans TaxID=76731 RepID=A0A0U3LKV8_9BURK|nr:sugar kinase [Roseateles depolymerans]ALV07042.1 2-dehydro-3-deoxygluconokinase [Roseateles depolymerans]REG20025.1 2-keto-3-deoxygluconate kinase [Roseateles depolymerans]